MKKITYLLLIFAFLSVLQTVQANGKNQAYKANKKLKLPTKLSKEWAKHNKIKPYIDEKGYIVIEPQISQPMIVCQLGQVCIFELATNEILIGENPISIGLDQWKIKSNVYQRNGKTITSLTLRPLNNEGETSLAIFTNFGSHNILLISSVDKSMRKTRLADNPENIKISSQVNFNPDQEKKEKRTQIKRKINRSYQIEVDELVQWKPVTVYDDGVSTFIFLSRNSKNYNSVRVSAIYNDSEETVNYLFDAKNFVLTIDGVHEKLYLTTNDEKAFVINNNF